MNPTGAPTPAASLAIDHLTILSRSAEAGAAFYGLVLPQLGFSQLKPGIWRNDKGLHLQLRIACECTRSYERYGPGLNAMRDWGSVDILVNNAGILRDTSFAKMTLADWDAVIRVHATGSANCTMACWPHMKTANYGRIVMTSSSSDLYGNFGQSNYGAAKMAVIGLMNVLHIEGAKNNIRVNTLAPGAATQMTRDLLPPKVVELMEPEAVTPGLLYLVSEDAPSRVILDATAGGFARTFITESEGIYLSPEDCTPENVAARIEEISSMTGAAIFEQGGQQVTKFIAKAAASLGVALA